MTGTACDEWPWAATHQGGPGAHLRILNFNHNSASGSDLNAFYTVCGVATDQSFAVLPHSPAAIVGRTQAFRLC